MQVDKNFGLGLVLAVASALFLVLGMGALGIVGDGGSPDRLYLAVLVVGVLGTILVRLRAGGMALTLFAMAGTQALVTAVAIGAALLGVGEFDGASIADLVMVNAMYVVLFLASGWLFRRAADTREPTAAAGRG